MIVPSAASLRKAGTESRVSAGFMREAPVRPDAHAPGVASSVPNASYTRGAAVATLAQTKYNAPQGWSTPAGGKGEGYAWTTPTGRTVYGFAPGIFREK